MRQASFKEGMELWSKPERVIFVTATDNDGNPHIMTVGWKMRTSFRPPMLAVAIGKQRSMHEIIKESGEFVVAVPGADLSKEVLICGKSSNEEVNRFELCGFSQKPGNFVKAPLIHKCIASFECKVTNLLDTGDHTIFVGQVLATWVHEEPMKNLLVVDEDEGYERLAEEGPYKIGVVKST